MICAGCLAALSTARGEPAPTGARRFPRIPVFPILQLLGGLAFTYTLFHATGNGLAHLPTKFHEGSYLRGMVDFIRDPTQFDETEN